MLVDCPKCETEVEIEETNFDNWDYPYEWSNCPECDIGIITTEEKAVSYRNYLRSIK